MKKLKFTAIAILLTIVATPLVGCVALNEEEANKMTENIIALELKNISKSDLDIKVDGYLSNMKQDGSYADIDYKDTSQSNWKPIEHLDRLRDMARAYVFKDSKHYNSKQTFDKVVAGLGFWITANKKSTNWFYASIANPQRYAPTIIMIDSLDNKLNENLRKDILKYWKKTSDKPEDWTGANTVDIALHWLYRGIYTHDLGLVNRAIKNAYGVIEITQKEGIQADYSYQQHGAQIYNLGYGNSILNALTAFAQVTIGTKFIIPKAKLQILSSFVLKGYITAFRGKYGLYNQEGRGVSRINALDKQSYAKALANMAVIDVDNKQAYLDAVDRINGVKAMDYGVEDSNTFFYKSDYALQRNKQYSFDVRMASSRTCRTEWGNKENLKGYFMSDGGYSLYKSGLEYYNVFPLWNWSMIPGVTAPQTADIPLAKEWEQNGVGKFVGGLSSGLYGVATYSYYDTFKGVNTGPNKGYFMFGDEIICLGSNINSTNINAIYTTVNQVNYGGEYKILSQNTSKIGTSTQNVAMEDIVVHDGIGYQNMSSIAMTVKAETRQGNWQDINFFEGNKQISGQVFSVYFDHGVKPSGASYAYAILPQYFNGQNAKSTILANDIDKQVVYRQDLKAYASIFYKPGQYTVGELSVSVNKPCVVMVVGDSVYISDPTQKLKSLKVTVVKSGNVNNITAKFGGKNNDYGSSFYVKL